MKTAIKINDRHGTSWSSLCMVLLVLCLTLLNGCGSVETYKNTLRDASGTMVRITVLYLRFEGSPTGGYLEKVEDRVLYACKNLLDSADYRFRSEKIPWDTKIRVVFTASECQNVVDQAQPELEELQLQALSPPN